jgi:hypothetical protein
VFFQELRASNFIALAAAMSGSSDPRLVCAGHFCCFLLLGAVLSAGAVLALVVRGELNSRPLEW